MLDDKRLAEIRERAVRAACGKRKDDGWLFCRIDAPALLAENARLTDENARLARELGAAKADLLYALENSDSLMSCEPCTHRGYHPEDGMYCKLKACRPEWRGICPANTPDAREGGTTECSEV